MPSLFSKRIRRTIIVLVVLFCLLAAAWPAARNYVLHKAVDYAEAIVEKKYNSKLTINESYFSGFKKISLVGINLIPENEDTLLEADTLVLEPSIKDLFTGHLILNSFKASSLHLNIIKNDSTSNYHAFVHSSNKTDTITTRDYAKLANKLLEKIFYYTPGAIVIEHGQLTASINTKKESLSFSLSRIDNNIESTLKDEIKNKTWKMNGTIKNYEKTFALKLYGIDTQMVKPLPFIETILHGQLYFDTLYFSLDKNRFINKKLLLSGRISANKLIIHHEKIAQDEVTFNQLAYDYNVSISDHAFTADNSNLLQINNISANAGFCYSNDGSKEYEINFKTDTMPANDFFASLPPGMFNNFEGMNAAGAMQYIFHFKLNAGMPDSLEFESSLTKDHFHIINYGVTNFSMLNNDFVYTAYEHDLPFRTIYVNRSNPDFIPLQAIPLPVINAVLTSEDGSFFTNNGFNESAFKKSIAQNYEAGKFVRGGSTITMQLVKNVFLSRHKTIARKAEEALIVWLIESNNLVDKERMLEVYLNIAEFGPNVYGVSEAAKFYFNKNARDLTLPESIFLASLLPRPKWFKYSFEKDGTLKPYFADYFRVVSNYLLKKNLITQDEYDHLKPEITLSGPARNAVMPTDSVPQNEGDEDE